MMYLKMINKFAILGSLPVGLLPLIKRKLTEVSKRDAEEKNFLAH